MKRHATAIWYGTLTDGQGQLQSQSGVLTNHIYSYRSRFKDQRGVSGTNPEELMAAAHAGCFAMQLAHMLSENGTPADKLEARAFIEMEKQKDGFTIVSSTIELTGVVPDIGEKVFLQLAEKAKETCPVSKALGNLKIELKATLSHEKADYWQTYRRAESA